MGYQRSHAIVVTSWSDDVIRAARAEAQVIFGQESPFEVPPPGSAFAALVSEIAPCAMNGGGSFLIAPDGSKEGWAVSDWGDSLRSQFIEWLDQQRHSDGSSTLRWVEVQFADDRDESIVVRHSEEIERVQAACSERDLSEEGTP